MGKMTSEIRRKIEKEKAKMDRKNGEFNINDKRKIVTKVFIKYKIKNLLLGKNANKKI